MSFGSQTGRTRSGTKSFSGSRDRKLRRKKQEFHTHRRQHLEVPGPVDPEQVRARTVIALDRLGHQLLSTEPGGYDLEDWTRSLNSLLDDFEEKVGPDRITDEFRRRREEAVRLVAKPQSGSSAPSEIEAEIARLVQEQAGARTDLEDARRNALARLASLRAEREACARELKAAEEKLAEIRKANQSRQFFSRVLRAGASTGEAEANIVELKEKLGRLEEAERSQRAAQTSGGAGAEGDEKYIEARKRLGEIQQRLTELQATKHDSLQLAREREIATQTIAGVIESMKLNGSTTGEERA